MKTLVTEMYEDFIMSEACSRYYALDTEGTNNAQDELLVINYSEHASLCEKAAKACLSFIKTNNFVKLVIDFKMLELYDNINVLRLKYEEIKKY